MKKLKTLILVGLSFLIFDNPSSAQTGGSNYSVEPTTKLVLGLDGNFYGTTTPTSDISTGNVYRVLPSGQVQNVYDFGIDEGSGDLVLGSDGNLYGTAYSGQTTAFKLTLTGMYSALATYTDASVYTYRFAGLSPTSPGNFVGASTFGGANAEGSIFSLTSSGTKTVLGNFNYSAPNGGGTNPLGVILASDGNYYGTCFSGGSSDTHNYGCVFKMTPTGTLSTLVAFNVTNGATPFSGLIQGTDNRLYGTTAAGGANNKGTVFAVTLSGTLTTLISFNGTNGAGPQAPIMQASDGNFYGTTATGGANNEGTVFQLTQTANVLTTLVSFNGTNGNAPEAGVTEASDGTLWGTTILGGVANEGTVFKVSKTGTFTSLYSFYAFPKLSSAPSGQAIAVGNSIAFSVTASSPDGSALSYQWQKNGVNISGATTSSYSISSVATTDAAIYTVVVTNNSGSVSFMAQLLVLASQPTPQVAPIGGSATFTVNPIGTGPFTYQWKFNGQNISGATGSSYTVNNVQTSKLGNYSVTISDASGSATTIPVSLTLGTPTMPQWMFLVLGVLFIATVANFLPKKRSSI